MNRSVLHFALSIVEIWVRGSFFLHDMEDIFYSFTSSPGPLLIGEGCDQIGRKELTRGLEACRLCFPENNHSLRFVFTVSSSDLQQTNG